MCGSLAFIEGLQGQQWNIALWLLIYTACQTFAKPKTAAKEGARLALFAFICIHIGVFIGAHLNSQGGSPQLK
jgi:hypothetical protein